MKYAFVLALLLAACGDRVACSNGVTADTGAPRAASREQAIAAARAFLTARHTTPPSIVDAIDMGDRWGLSYRCAPRECGTGGVTLAIVNKTSGEVVHWEGQQ